MRRGIARQSVVASFAVTGYLLALACSIIVVYQTICWLRTGNWPTFTADDARTFLGIPFPQTEWVGITKILSWILDQPLSVDLLVLGFGLMGMARAVGGVLDEHG